MSKASQRRQRRADAEALYELHKAVSAYMMTLAALKSDAEQAKARTAVVVASVKAEGALRRTLSRRKGVPRS